MPSLTEDRARLVARAAQLRAAGNSWAAIANELQVDLEIVSALPSDDPALWQHAYEAGAKTVLEESLAEAMHLLRALMRSEDKKLRRDAIALRLTLHAQLARCVAAESSNQVVASAHHVEELTDDELLALLAEFAQQMPVLGDGGLSGGSGTAGTKGSQ